MQSRLPFFPLFLVVKAHNLLTKIRRTAWRWSTTRSHIWRNSWCQGWWTRGSRISRNRRWCKWLTGKCASSRSKGWSTCLHVWVPWWHLHSSCSSGIMPSIQWSSLRILPYSCSTWVTRCLLHCKQAWIWDCIISTSITMCLQRHKKPIKSLTRVA